MMTRSVLLIAPPQLYCSHVAGRTGAPLHLVYLKAAIRDIAKTGIMDLERLVSRPGSREELAALRRMLQQRLTAMCPANIVGISCYTSFHYQGTLEVARVVRSVWPGAVIVVGGYHATACPEDFNSGDLFDCVVVGEGEHCFRAVVEAGGVDGTKPVVLRARPLKPIHWPTLRGGDLQCDRGQIALALSRGCHMKCRFCCESAKTHELWRGMEVDAALRMVEICRRIPSCREIRFADACFGKNRSWIRKFLQGLISMRSGLRFWMECRVDTLDDDLLDLAATLDIVLYFGVETFSVEMVQIMGKANDGDSYVRRALASIHCCIDRDIPLEIGILVNHPGERLDTACETFARVREIVRSSRNLSCTFHAFAFRLFPGNAIYADLDALGDAGERLFPNRGWWRRSDTDLSAACESFMASVDIANRFGSNHRYWQPMFADAIDGLPDRLSVRSFRLKTAGTLENLVEGRRLLDADLEEIVRLFRRLDQVILEARIACLRFHSEISTEGRSIQATIMAIKTKTVGEIIALLDLERPSRDGLGDALERIIAIGVGEIEALVEPGWASAKNNALAERVRSTGEGEAAV